jgi:formylglycine-generating enzyme required for sulfatase activity
MVLPKTNPGSRIERVMQKAHRYTVTNECVYVGKKLRVKFFKPMSAQTRAKERYRIHKPDPHQIKWLQVYLEDKCKKVQTRKVDLPAETRFEHVDTLYTLYQHVVVMRKPLPPPKPIAPNPDPSFVMIPKCDFWMGSPDNGTEPDRYPDETLHHVVLDYDFEMAIHEVTQAKWFDMMGNNPSNFKDKKYCPKDHEIRKGVGICLNLPVENVSYGDIKNHYLPKLNASQGRYVYRLSTEAEWECAARAGSKGAYSYGSDPAKLGAHAWFYDNSGLHSPSGERQTREVGTRKPNKYGLYDMYGNVLEWVEDAYAPYPKGPVKTPMQTQGSDRVFRGGSWWNDASDCRSARRLGWSPGDRGGNLGFRLVRTKR